MAANVTLTTIRPEPPVADFAFEVDFKKGEGSASRVFSAINDFIRGCERLDAELVGTIDGNIETVMVLEDIEAGSIKVWLRNALHAVDDDALKRLIGRLSSESILSARNMRSSVGLTTHRNPSICPILPGKFRP